MTGKHLLTIAMAICPLAGVEAKTWNAAMSEMATTMSDLVPELFSESDKPEVVEKLKQKSKKLYEITRDIDQGVDHSVKPNDADPTIKFISKRFRQDVGIAYEGIQGGNLAFGRHIMRGSLSYCVACHTRTQDGPKFPLISAFNKHIDQLSWTERVRVQAATRQFEPAFKDVIAMLNKPAAPGIRPFEIEKGARTALSIAVRVNESPDAVIQLAQVIGQSKLAGDSLKKDAEVWLKDARDWKNEKAVALKTDTDHINHAKKLINKGEELSLTTFVPHAEVRYLRASNLMHNMLKKYPKSKSTAEALYLVGLSYDVLRDIGLWGLHEAFYESCIERSPNTAVSAKCFQKYEDSVVAGFTGSAGISIPSGIRDHINKLREQATDKSAGSGKKI